MFPSNFIKGTTLGIVSVKVGENIGVSMIRDLMGIVERERAGVGVFLTLTEPTKPMIAEAVSAGLHEEPGFSPDPRIQIVTVEDALHLRERAVHPPPAAMTPSSAPRARKPPTARARSTPDTAPPAPRHRCL